MQVHFLFLLPMAFLLPSGTWAGRIIGGHEAEPHSRPYMAFLHVQEGDNYKCCGGFLVSENFVLTAAHCQGESITVVLGAHNISQWEPSQQVIRVRRQIPHPQYNDIPNNNDIMILQLQEPANINDEVGLLPLPPAKERVQPGTHCSVAGWGQTDTNREGGSATLREVTLKVQDDRECQKGRTYNRSTMMCVGDPKKRQASFRGDSGGPLVCRGVAQGIVSFGPSSGKPPRVFARLSTFVPWIEETMEGLQP
ncbi:mast cell protease 1A-like [Pelodiscus sinensis]|uniref:mast cell protease 1A-like n=1 Tax=Pelodiscus sinensis TaxID=13735 RepID=UPI003F6C3AFC